MNLKTLFSLRPLLGSLLFLVIVGEVTVGAKNGLFTVPGCIVLGALYLLYFALLDSLISKYKLSNLGVLLVNFALYSILITGLLHGEIADYILRPQDRLITTLIRMQSCFFPLFAFSIIDAVAPRKVPALPVSKSILWFGLFVLILTPSKQFGFIKMMATFQQVPQLAILACLTAVVALIIGLRQRAKKPPFRNKTLLIWACILFLLGCLPQVAVFLTLLMLTIFVSLVYLARPGFRNASPGPKV